MRGLPLETATGAKRRLLRWTERISCAFAHAVVCVSPSLRDRALSERISTPSKLRVLSRGSGQGVDAEGRFNPDAAITSIAGDVRARLGIPQQAIVFGFLGRLAREKGVGELVSAFQSIANERDDVHLIIAGGRDVRDPLDSVSNVALDENRRIHVLEHIEATALYRAIDIVVLPTYREGFPNVLLEAAAMRKPVVATRVTGCVDAVVDGTTGMLVPPRDPSSLATAMRRYADDVELRERHGTAARERVVRDYRREDIWSELDRLYQYLSFEAARPVYDHLKRGLDVVVSSTALAVFAAPMVGVGVAVATRMGRPAVFAHDRPGKGERLFKLYKFRTMTNDRDAAGELLPDADRITKLGAFLRRTSLDELPELLNVLNGDMSLVGPRPLLVRYLPFYTERERARHRVLPGITGLAQVQGRNEVSWNERLAYDTWYCANRSLRLDLRILWKTLALVARAEGVVVDPRSTMLNLDEERATAARGG
jgi:lipopolysaccharide/colanic/teichoic acid biosynthesis glycosyltransferase